MLKENEYLSININTEKALYLANKALHRGEEKINLAAFEQLNKPNDKCPDFTNQGVAIWVNKKKDKEPTITNEEI